MWTSLEITILLAILALRLFYKWRNWGTERLRFIFKVAQVVSVRADFEPTLLGTRACATSGLGCLGGKNTTGKERRLQSSRWTITFWQRPEVCEWHSCWRLISIMSKGLDNENRRNILLLFLLSGINHTGPIHDDKYIGSRKNDQRWVCLKLIKIPDSYCIGDRSVCPLQLSWLISLMKSFVSGLGKCKKGCSGMRWEQNSTRFWTASFSPPLTSWTASSKQLPLPSEAQFSVWKWRD